MFHKPPNNVLFQLCPNLELLNHKKRRTLHVDELFMSTLMLMHWGSFRYAQEKMCWKIHHVMNYLTWGWWSIPEGFVGLLSEDRSACKLRKVPWWSKREGCGGNQRIIRTKQSYRVQTTWWDVVGMQCWVSEFYRGAATSERWGSCSILCHQAGSIEKKFQSVCSIVEKQPKLELGVRANKGRYVAAASMWFHVLPN